MLAAGEGFSGGAVEPEIGGLQMHGFRRYFQATAERSSYLFIVSGTCEPILSDCRQVNQSELLLFRAAGILSRLCWVC